MASSDGIGGLPRRRNGKQQACEPCRKAKVSCDHTLPTCDRCRRRKISAKCVYLAAPMTRPVPDASTRSAPLITGMPPTPPTGSSASPASSLFKDSNPKPNPESGPFIKSGGFFGPTNFSAVFLENRENLGHDDIQISNDSEPYVASYESLQSQTFLMLAGQEPRRSPRVALGAKVLSALPDQQTCKILLGWFLEKNQTCTFPKVTLVDLANSLWTTYARELAEPRRPEDLEAVSSILCKTAETALEEFDDYDRWYVACSGTNLRWEMLGQVFGALTTSVLSLPEKDPFFASQRGERRNRRNFSVEMKDCVQACITLSNYMDLINVSMVGLLLKNLILQTVISGDVSLVVWRQLGDLVSANTALGLHRLTPGEPITFISEMKKRMFNATFFLDMGSSLLTGRPPSLSYRFSRLQLPVDVSDEVLMRGGEVLQRAADALDSNGWNREGNIYTNTMMRTRTLLAPILNEALELFLGEGPQDTIGDSIKNLMNRIQQTYDSFPEFVKFNMTDVSNPEVSDSKLWSNLCLRLAMLEHRLLLERLAFKQKILDGQSMVDCAREMLELTVLIWVQRDRFVEHHHDYDWMLMCWGIPSSGVLCVELLKQTKQPQSMQHMLRIPRSEIVQNLSLLIGFLEWIKPSAGNYQLCGRMRQIIKRILDQILNPGLLSLAPTSSQEEGSNIGNGFETGNGMGGPYDPMLDVGFDDGLDHLEWLNTVDWSRGPWVDLQDFSAVKWG